MTAIGIDIGGTWARAGWIDVSGRWKHRMIVQTPVDDPDALVSWIANAIGTLRDMIQENDRPVDESTLPPLPVGLALPGLFDHSKGAVTKCINLTSLENRPIVRELRALTGLQVHLVSDADAAAWAEYLARRKQKIQRFVHLRLGTGVGCSLIYGNKCQPIEKDRAGHLDMLVVDRSPSAPLCRCGKSGCLDAIASGAALVETARQAAFNDGLTELETRFLQGDADAMGVFATITDALASGLLNIQRECQPDVICVGGGVIDAIPSLLRSATKRIREIIGPDRSARLPHTESAILGDSAGVIGAALLASQEQRSVK